MSGLLHVSPQPTELHSFRCLNNRHVQAGCDNCFRTCPTHAIVLDQKEVRVNTSDCVNCGLCLHICPAEVFVSSKWDESTVLNPLPELSSERVELFCAYHKQPHVGEKSVGSVQVPVCLAALSPAIWFELGTKKNITACLDACHGCALSSTVPYIKQGIGLANEWLGACGCSTRIQHLERDDQRVTHETRPVSDTRKPEISRRGFFRVFVRAFEAAASDEGDQVELIPHDRGSWKMPRHIPSWTTRIATVYQEECRGTGRPVLWPSVQISDECVVCGVCTDYCPTGALFVEQESNRYGIRFIPGRCLDCEICRVSCPSGAIKRGHEITAEPFESSTTVTHEMTYCRRCGRPSPGTSHLCYWCTEEPGLSEVLDDARQWLVPNQKPTNR